VKPALVLVPLALEWVVIASTIAPLWLGFFTKRPRFGIAAWLTLFVSAILATATAIFVSFWSVIDNFANLDQHRQNLFLTIVFSVLPWLLFAMAGIAINLINIKLDPIVSKFKQLFASPVLPGKKARSFEGVPVEAIDIDAFFALAVARPSKKILLSRTAIEQLTDQQLDAVLWHEYAHLKAHHNGLRRFVRVVETLTGFVRASKVMSHEVDRLCEVAADQFAAKRVDAAVLKSARAKFL
jgi:Zn-dependent protease with chaperone function